MNVRYDCGWSGGSPMYSSRRTALAPANESRPAPTASDEQAVRRQRRAAGGEAEHGRRTLSQRRGHRVGDDRRGIAAPSARSRPPRDLPSDHRLDDVQVVVEHRDIGSGAAARGGRGR